MKERLLTIIDQDLNVIVRIFFFDILNIKRKQNYTNYCQNTFIIEMVKIFIVISYTCIYNSTDITIINFRNLISNYLHHKIFRLLLQHTLLF